MRTQPVFTCLNSTIESLEKGGVFIVNFGQIPHLFSSVSIANFEHVNAGWVRKNVRKTIISCLLIHDTWMSQKELRNPKCMVSRGVHPNHLK